MEYKATIQYVVFSSTLKGTEYEEIAEKLRVHASQELAHAFEVAKQIDYLDCLSPQGILICLSSLGKRAQWTISK